MRLALIPELLFLYSHKASFILEYLIFYRKEGNRYLLAGYYVLGVVLFHLIESLAHFKFKRKKKTQRTFCQKVIMSVPFCFVNTDFEPVHSNMFQVYSSVSEKSCFPWLFLSIRISYTTIFPSFISWWLLFIDQNTYNIRSIRLIMSYFLFHLKTI